MNLSKLSKSFVQTSKLWDLMIIYLFLIRNKEEYINRRKDTGERKVTKEREESKGRMRGPSYTNWTKEKTPNNRTLKTKRNPNNLQTFEAQTAIQLSCKTLRGTPLKALVQEAHREE